MSRLILPFIAEHGLENFLKKVSKAGPDECWPWTFGKDPAGYGVWYGAMRAHRVAWVIANGCEIPDGMNVLHHCDNPPCCNTAHLFIGTHGDNVADKTLKMRQSHGETHGRAKLTNEQVLEIRRRYASGERENRLAEEFNISSCTVNAIIVRRIWKHLEPRPEEAIAANRNRGEDVYCSKLTEADVLDIRSRYIPGTGSRNRGNSKELADEYGIRQPEISRIITRKRWSHI